MMLSFPWFLGGSRPYMHMWGNDWGWGTNWGWTFGWLIIPLMLWSVIWTGLALWYAARRGDKWWFLVFLVVHTAGILEIIYLVFVAHAFAKPRRSRRKR